MRSDEAPDADWESQVARFLAENPDWLAQRPGLYGRLSPPRRVHGEALADHMAAMIDAARRQAADMARRADSVLHAGRAALGLSDRVRAAVLALIRAAEIEDWVSVDLPRLMGLDAARLCAEQAGGPEPAEAWPRAGHAMAQRLPRGTVARLLGTDSVRVRQAPQEAALLHGEAAQLAACDALVRVPVPGRRPMLLAMASRDPAILSDGRPASAGGPAGAGGTAALAFLGEALAARIEAIG